MSEHDFWDVSWTVRDIPPSHTHCTFHGFEWDRESGLKGRIRPFLESLDEEEAETLFLTGKPGTGKTHIAVASFRWAALRYGLESVVFRNVPKFCDEVKRSFDSGEDPFQRLRDVDQLFVLDDIMGRALSQFEMENILNRLLDLAYTNNASLIVTTNYTTDEIKDSLHPHEVSRLLRNSNGFQFESSDHRLE